ncbi:MAG TPA: rRNA pseudouridine synthase [Clostridiaceae bacterium]|nr:rRNA pseudouridine synthase [Clostridiaceae bacterium]
MERLDKILAKSGYGTRKEVKHLIKEGRVELAGEVITDVGFKISLQSIKQISVDGYEVEIHNSLIFMLNKPAGFITALSDTRHDTIAELIPRKWQNKGLVAIGRLDKDTEGLLLLTNDGQLSHRICSPKWGIEKEYHLITQGRPFDQQDIERFAQGFKTLDGTEFKPAKLKLVDGFEACLTVREGQYHQVKRMAKATGREVKYLRRIRIANLQLDPDLAPGEIRMLTEDERVELYSACQLED